MRPRRPSSSPDRVQPRRVSLVVPLSVVAAVLVLGWLGARKAGAGPTGAPWTGLFRSLAQRGAPAPEPPPLVWVSPASLAERPGGLTGWLGPEVDPRWAAELAATLRAHPPFPIGPAPDHADPSASAEPTAAAARVALAALERDVRGLSFVREATLDADFERGLALDVELREPVACVPVGSDFLLVDEEGVLLSGRWPAPTHVGGCPLPVLGPMTDAGDLFQRARAGDWLVEDEHLDALDVALSLREHLDADTRGRLGCVVIDATRARRSSSNDPGVRLQLEGRRLVLFGRTPSANEPGELAVEEKWRNVARALELLGDPENDWSLADVRWDRPELVLQHADRVASLDVPEGASARSKGPRPEASNRPRTPARSTRPDDGRPRVR